MNKSDIRNFLRGMTVEDEIESLLREADDISELTLGTNEYEEYIEELIGRLKNVKRSVKSRTNQGKMYRKEADRLQSAITSLKYLNNRSQRIKNKNSKDLLDENFSRQSVREFLYNTRSSEEELINERVKMSGEFAFAREGGCEFDMTRLNFPIAKQLTNPKTQKALSNIGRMLAVPKPFCDLLNISSRALGIFFGEEGDSNIEGEKINSNESDAKNSEIESELKGLHLRKVFEDAVSESKGNTDYNSDYSLYFNHFLPSTSSSLKRNVFLTNKMLDELKTLKQGLANIKTYANTNPSNVEMLMKVNEVLKLEKSSKYEKLLRAIRKIADKQNDVGMPTEQKEYVKAGYNYQMTKLVFKILDDDFEDGITEDLIKLEEKPEFAGIKSKLERYLQGIKEEIRVVVK